MEKFLLIVSVLLLALAIDLVLCYPIMLLWNWVVPTVFGFSAVTFWQMFGIEVLVTILFNNFGGN